MKASLSNICSKVQTKVKVKSPEILFAFGVVSFFGTMYLTYRQSKKTGEIEENHKRRMLEIDNALELSNEPKDVTEIVVDENGVPVEAKKVTYTAEEARKNRFEAYCETGLSYCRVFAPAIAMGAVSLACFGSSFGILKKRNAALSALYTATDAAFKKYRERVVEDQGEEKDKEYRFGTRKEKIVNEETGEEIEADTVPWDEDDGLSTDTVFEFAPWTTFKYSDNDILDSTTLNVSRENMQFKFEQEGSLFLNDVLHDLGMKKVPYGQLVGWKKGIGDPYVDYKIERVYHALPQNDPVHNPKGLRYQVTYKLEFNTCGIVWDKI